MKTTARLAAGLATVTLSFGALSAPAHAAPKNPKPACSQQTKQVAKAEDALERVSAVFARQKAKVVKAKKAVAQADSASERGQARRALARAKAKKTVTLKAKKAQVQRLAKAQQRLAACQAAQQPTTAPAA